MKKSLIALAALAATASFAQSSVTISGSVDVAYATRSVTAADGTNLGKSTGISEGQNTANKINFAVTEDLGGGLKAGAMIEQGLNITNGALTQSRAAAAGIQAVNVSTSGEIPLGAYGTAVNRQSYVFVNGGFGEVRAGYTRTNLYEQSTFSGYLVGQEQYGSLLHTIGNANFGGTRGNGLTWITPKFNGFSATLQYGAGGDRESTTTASAAGLNGLTDSTLKRTGIKVDYNNGPLNLAYGRTNVTAKSLTGTGYASALNIFGAAAAVTAGADYKSHLDQFTGSYQIGDLKLAAQYLKGTKDNNAITAANNAGTAASASSVDYKAAILGATYNIGNFGLFASVGNGSVQTQGAAAKTNDIKQQQYGVRYNMSKRTVAYVMSGTSKDSIQTGSTGNAKATVTAVGLMHNF